MNSSFSKRDKRQSKNRGCNANVKMEIMFWKRVLYKCLHIYAYILMWKALFQSIIYQLGIANPFS